MNGESPGSVLARIHLAFIAWIAISRLTVLGQISSESGVRVVFVENDVYLCYSCKSVTFFYMVRHFPVCNQHSVAVWLR